VKLYLVRHAQPVGKEVNAARPLSDAGRQEAERVAAHLRDLGVQLVEILHSTKARAAQTAGIIRAHLDGARVIETEGLAPDDPVEPLVDRVGQAEQDTMIVGHLPFLPALAARLLGGPADLAFPTAGVVVLARGPDGGWSVQDQFGPQSLSTTD